MYLNSDIIIPSSEQNLSISLEDKGFVFAVSSDKGKLLKIGHCDADLTRSMAETITQVKQALAEKGISPIGMHSVRLVLCADRFVWMPDSLYEAGKERQYLGAVCDVPAGMGLFVEHNDAVQAHCIFAYDNTLVTAFKIALPGLKVGCQHSRFVNPALLQRSDLKNLLLVNMRSGRCDVMVLCNKTLQLSNSYDAANMEEAAYHALNLTQQLRLSEADMEVLLCGKVSEEDYHFVARFFPKVDLYKGLVSSFANPEMGRLHIHQYSTVL